MATQTAAQFASSIRTAPIVVAVVAVVFAVVAVYQGVQISNLQSQVSSLSDHHHNTRSKRHLDDLEEQLKSLVERHVRATLETAQLSASQPLHHVVKKFVSFEVRSLQTHCANSSVLCLPGASGRKGEQGTKGEIGDVGIPGVAGRGGPKGQPGDAGPVGVSGVKGDKGDTGLLGARGHPGPNGAAGTSGPKGDKGQKGEKGKTGSSGPPGPKGDSGTGGIGPQPTACCLRLAQPSAQGQKQEIVHAKVGQTVTIPCKAAGYPPPAVTWNPTIAQLGTARFTKTTDGLLLQAVKATDNGKLFQCTLNNIFGSSSKTIKLDVTDPVTVSVTPTNPTFTEGTSGTVILRCRYGGYPNPSVVWLHEQLDGQRVALSSNIDNSSPGVSVLTITSPTTPDGGKYICRASNVLESKEAFATLTVAGKPVFLIPPQNQTVDVGTLVTLHCDVSAVPPAAITWTYAHNEVIPRSNVHVNTDNSLTITNIDNANEGQYVCTAKNLYGTVQAKATIQVTNPVTVVITPKKINLNTTTYVALECRATGDPTPIVKWSKQDGKIPKNNAHFIILGGDFVIASATPATQDQDSGVYICTASNGVTTKIAKAIVYKPLPAVDCTSSFQVCTPSIGGACGATCPSGCSSQPGNLFGYIDYTATSSLCKAAIHSGVITDAGGLVVWSMRDGSTLTFQGTTKHGITSSSTGPIHAGASIFVS